MVQTALGSWARPINQICLLEPAIWKQLWENLVSTFAEYGLGASTGIDLPNESTGFIPKEYNFANCITNAFGQFDNYTPMQLAQYVGTIANNGVRIAPHIVEGIYGNNEQARLRDLIQTVDTKEMNKINISESDVSILQQGFYQVSHGGSALTTECASFPMVQRCIH